MARNERLDYPGAVALFSEIRACDGWTCRHGYHDGHIGIWLSRTVAPHIKPTFIDQRDAWLWLRDMYEEMAENGATTQAPLPLDGSAGGVTTGEAAAAAPTHAKDRNDLRRLADSQHASDSR